jgi:hypothetical protein
LHAISSIDKEQFDAYMSKSIQAMEKAESATGLSNCYNLLAKNALRCKGVRHRIGIDAEVICNFGARRYPLLMRLFIAIIFLGFIPSKGE